MNNIPSSCGSEDAAMSPQGSRRMTAIEFLRDYNNVIYDRSKV